MIHLAIWIDPILLSYSIDNVPNSLYHLAISQIPLHPIYRPSIDPHNEIHWHDYRLQPHELLLVIN